MGKTGTKRKTVRTGTDGVIKGNYESSQGLSDELFRTLFECSNEGVIAADAKTKKFLFVNQNVCKMLGYSMKELLGLTVLDIHPKKDLPMVLKAFKNQFEKKACVAPDMPILRKDKSVFYCDIAAYPVKLYGMDLLMGLFRDVTEKKKAEDDLKKSEAKYRALYDSASDAILTLKIVPGKIPLISDCNHQTEVMLGGSREHIMGMDLKDILPHKQPNGLISSEHVAETVKKVLGGKSLSFEIVHRRLDGTQFFAELRVNRIDVGGETFMQAIVRDISERKRYEAALENSNVLIEAEVDRKTEEIKQLNTQLKEYADKLNMKIKRIDETRIPLTDKEKRAFFGLVRYPDLTSKEVAEKMGMNIATVNSIKNRLKAEGYFQTMYIPRLDLIGCTLLSVGRATVSLDKDRVRQLRAKGSLLDKLMSNPEKISILFTDKEFFSLMFSKDWSVYKQVSDDFDSEYLKEGVVRNQDNVTHFSTDRSVFYNYFNFASIINRQFDLGMEDSICDEADYAQYVLTKNEQLMAYGLVRYPESTVLELSKIVGMSVPTVCKLRKSLLDRGILKIANWPDMKKIGIELIGVMVSNAMRGSDHLAHKRPGCQIPRFFEVSSMTDSLILSAHRNYAEVKKCFDVCSECFGVSKDDISTTVISMEDVMFIKREFAPLVKKLFQLEVDF
ncbi:MAG: PAS domain S-box protein [Candidatus Woesearchaeota archaeon]